MTSVAVADRRTRCWWFGCARRVTVTATVALASPPLPLPTRYSIGGTGSAPVAVTWIALPPPTMATVPTSGGNGSHAVDDDRRAIHARVVVEHPEHRRPAGPDTELVVDGLRLAGRRHGRAVRRHRRQVVGRGSIDGVGVLVLGILVR